MAARSERTLVALLCACVDAGETADRERIEPVDTGEPAEANCEPEPLGNPLPTADVVIPNLVAWEQEPGWPAGCFVPFADGLELLSAADGRIDLLHGAICAENEVFLLIVDVSTADFVGGVALALPEGNSLGGEDARRDAAGWLHAAGVFATNSHEDIVWLYDESKGESLDSLLLDASYDWTATAWMGERLYVLGEVPRSEERGAYRFLADNAQPQTLADAEAFFPDWSSAGDVGDVDGDGLDDLVAYLGSEARAALFVSSDDAAAGPSELPEPFFELAEPALMLLRTASPAGDQDGDGVDDFAVVDGNMDSHFNEPSVVRLFTGAGESISEIVGLEDLTGYLAYLEVGDPTPLLFFQGATPRQYALAGPLCGVVDASGAVTEVDFPAGRSPQAWVGGKNFVGQFSVGVEDLDDYEASLYMWQ